MEEGLHINPSAYDVEELFKKLITDGRVYAVSVQGIFRLLDSDEYRELVFKSHGGSLPDLDFGALEKKYYALLGTSIRGYKPSQIIIDELCDISEPEAVSGRPDIKTNKRTKNSKHPLPFYLGSRRRF